MCSSDMNNSSKGRRKGPAATKSLKRRRQSNAVVQVATCLVDGFNCDLSMCRDITSTIKFVSFIPRPQRSRFRGRSSGYVSSAAGSIHWKSLMKEKEFVEGVRLAGHNKRRRKPQLEPLPKFLGAFLSDYQGKVFSPFSTPQMYPTLAVMNSSWDEVPIGSMISGASSAVCQPLLDTNFALGIWQQPQNVLQLILKWQH